MMFIVLSLPIIIVLFALSKKEQLIETKKTRENITLGDINLRWSNYAGQ
jgi:hypothetical protein